MLAVKLLKGKCFIFWVKNIPVRITHEDKLISIFDADDALHISISYTDDVLHIRIFVPKKRFALTFSDPKLRVPSLEYLPDIHIPGSVSHFQQST